MKAKVIESNIISLLIWSWFSILKPEIKSFLLSLIESYLEKVFKYFLNMLIKLNNRPLNIKKVKNYLTMVGLALHGFAMFMLTYNSGYAAVLFLYATSSFIILILINITYPNFRYRYPALY